MEGPYIRNNSIPRSVLRLYKPAESVVTFHDEDPHLDTITVKMPECPPIETIDGYGKMPGQQYWVRPEIPPRLQEVQERSRNLDQYFNTLDMHERKYLKEIEFIRREWDRRLNGYWLFINGVPTFIPPWHYFYIGYWRLDIGPPQYRSRDRKFFIFAHFAHRDTTLPDGKDMGRRICLGFNYPKHRREGANYKTECIMFEMVSRTPNSIGGIQSMDGPSAEKSFKEKLINPWKKLPAFFRPMHDGTTDPKERINFVPIATRSQSGDMLNIETGLQSYIDFATSANRSYYDGVKLLVLHNDECGKTTSEDVDKRHQITHKSLTLGLGLDIIGFEINTSTVGEMARGGGTNFKRLCSKSHYSERNPQTGQTESGLYNLFLPSYDCLEGFIDRFGNAIIDDPKPEELHLWDIPVFDSTGKPIGAKRYLESRREQLLASDDPESMEAFEEELRMTPMKYSECWVTEGRGNGLNLKKIVNRMKEIEFDNTLTQAGNYRWRDGKPDTTVEWVPDPKGRWKVSLKIPENETSLYITRTAHIEGKSKLVKIPLKPNRFTASADPFSFRKTRTKRKSKGSGSIFWHRDKDLDPDTKPIEQWESFRDVCTYNHRTLDPEEYAEDMLMMCVYWGAMMYPEINSPLIWNWFVTRGYDGYLKYYVDIKGNVKTTPGFFNRGSIPEDLFRKHQYMIENHCHRQRHIEILTEQKEIASVEELTDFDLFVAVGGSYLGADIDYTWMEKAMNKNMDKEKYSVVMPKRRY